MARTISSESARAGAGIRRAALIAMQSGVAIWRNPGGWRAPVAIGDICAAPCVTEVGAQAAAPKVKSGQRAR